MIYEFKISNHLSFKEEQVFHFKPSSEKTLSEYHIHEPKSNNKVLKTAMIYGANASGKTNLLKAIDSLQTYTTQAITKKEAEDWYFPFRYDKERRSKPTRYEISFFIKNEKFSYILEIIDTIIFHEKLTAYYSTQPSIIYERKYNKQKDNYTIETGTKIKFSKFLIEVIKIATNKYSTILSAVSKINAPKILDEVYDWFDNIEVNERDDFSLMSNDYFYDLFNENKEAKEFVLSMLRKIDFNIVNFHFQKTNDKYEPYKLIFQHKLDGSDEIITFEEHEESEGTLGAFALFSNFVDILSEDANIIIIDEIENSLHPELVNFFINSFLSYTKNEPYQLIFTTHNISLLDEDFVRKDSVWFTEKKEDASTELFSLTDFDIKEELILSKAYKQGKFGAIPNISTIF